MKYLKRRDSIKLTPIGAALVFILSAPAGLEARQIDSSYHIIHPLMPEQVQIDDPFWSPKLKTWRTVTINDVFDKFEGKYNPDRQDLVDEEKKTGRTRDGFLNFKWVAEGKSNTGLHVGPPWYDGLIYETIRAAADFLASYPDTALENRVDRYIDLIAEAQAADRNGYLNTYTTLTQPGHKWGLHGGNDVWQHDIYNAGMLIDAAVHDYRSTGKTKLLEVAVRLANEICRVMGPAPRSNMVPGHAGPEEAMLELYRLFEDHPGLSTTLRSPAYPQQYYEMGHYWITDRGNHGHADGSYRRNSFGAYDQDSISVFEQQSLEGHAVRATLLASGMTAAALENKDARYIRTVNRYWDNMVGKRMFITGGEGAIPDQERFGPDYDLPQSAYLETCAAVGAAFFCQRMNQLQGDGRYMDAFERALYNNVLSGVSLDGHHYFYENPLEATDNARWSWHSCPCCPPMFLKLMAALPRYIYARDSNGIYVNLFIGSKAELVLGNGQKVTVEQQTRYPWQGISHIKVYPDRPGMFTINVRIPGWAAGRENPFGLYHSEMKEAPVLRVNGRAVELIRKRGYIAIRREWHKGDKIEIDLPVSPRQVYANDSVKSLRGEVALAAGPLLYSFEKTDNPDYKNYVLPENTSLEMRYLPGFLGGVNVITGNAKAGEGKKVKFRAVPFYAIDNRGYPASYKLWMPEE